MDLARLLVWMEPWIDASFHAPAFDPSIAAEILPAAGRNEPAHAALLRRYNGFFALEGLLHVFGACAAPPNHSLRAWNAPDGWRAAWGLSTEGLTFFAEDAFGDQFGYRGGKIVRFRASIGRIEAMQATLEEWIEAVTLEPDYTLNQRVFRECVRAHGPLARGGHFVSNAPRVEGQPLDPATVTVVPSRDSLEMMAASASRVVRRSTSGSMRIPKS
jgi:hypothetical protein